MSLGNANPFEVDAYDRLFGIASNQVAGAKIDHAEDSARIVAVYGYDNQLDLYGSLARAVTLLFQRTETVRPSRPARHVWQSIQYIIHL